MKHLKNFESFANEAYDGNMSDFKYEFPMKFEEVTGNPEKAIKRITKSGKGYEVRTSTYMSEDEMKAVGAAMNLDLISYNKGSNVAITVFESKVNEEYVELPSIDVPSTDLIEAFKQWYKDTADNWEDFKNDMAEDSVDEAAKNAQMEILANLSNEMNLVIKDRKFKVRMDLK